MAWIVVDYYFPSFARLLTLGCPEIWWMRTTTCHTEERSQSSGLHLRYVQPSIQKLNVIYSRVVVCLMFVQALHFKKYSTASDVWSYGAVMYEIWSIGHKPFEGYSNSQVCNKSNCLLCMCKSMCLCIPKGNEAGGERVPAPPSSRMSQGYVWTHDQLLVSVTGSLMQWTFHFL